MSSDGLLLIIKPNSNSTGEIVDICDAQGDVWASIHRDVFSGTRIWDLAGRPKFADVRVVVRMEGESND